MVKYDMIPTEKIHGQQQESQSSDQVSQQSDSYAQEISSSEPEPSVESESDDEEIDEFELSVYIHDKVEQIIEKIQEMIRFDMISEQKRP